MYLNFECRTFNKEPRISKGSANYNISLYRVTACSNNERSSGSMIELTIKTFTHSCIQTFMHYYCSIFKMNIEPAMPAGRFGSFFGEATAEHITNSLMEIKEGWVKKWNNIIFKRLLHLKQEKTHPNPSQEGSSSDQNFIKTSLYKQE